MKEVKATITRRNLFEKIWSTSMRHTAKEYDITDGSLRKVCKAHKIPIPPKGFYARLKASPSTHLPRLPTRHGWHPNLIELVEKQNRRTWLQRKIPSSATKVPLAIVSPRGPLSHPYSKRTQRLVERAKPDDAGILISEEGLLAHLRVSKATLARALRLLDALLIALDQEPFSLNWPEGSDTRLTILVKGERFRFSIEELIEFTRRAPSVAERQRQRQDWTIRPGRWHYKLTSRLKLVIQGIRGRPLKCSWTDGKLRRLEVCLHEFLLALVAVAEEQRKERGEEGGWRLRWDRQATLEKAMFVKQDETLRRTAILSRAVTDWESATKLRGFLAALKPAVAQIDDVERRQWGQELASWIEKRASALDPIHNLIQLIDDFTNRNSPSTETPIAGEK